MNNDLALIAKESNLPNSKVQELLSNFGESFKQAKAITEKSAELEVTDTSQIKEMQLARTSRLELKNIRVEVEHTRKELKEQSLREGKAIDGMANIIKALIIPVEERLEKMEKFAEIKAAEQKAKRHAERLGKLGAYVSDTSIYSLEDMADEAFDNLLAGAKQAHEDRIAADKKAEQDRIARQKAEAEEQAKIRAENEKLRAEQQKREAEIAKERAEQAKKLEIQRAENEKKLEAERQARVIEQQKREQLEQEQRNREALEVKIKLEEEEKQRRSLLAPDKEKLLAFANTIDSLELPKLANREAGKLLDETEDFLNRISKNLRQKAKEL